MKKLLLFAAVLVLSLGSSTAGYYLYKYNSPSEQQFDSNLTQPIPVLTSQDVTGQLRPEFSLPDIHGEIHHIREWDGQVIAINFWATWCQPCLKEIPEFIALQDKYSKQGLQFLGIALQSAEEVTDFVKSLGINYPVLVGELEVIDLASSLGNDMGTLPYTVIIDRQKRINFIKNGRLDSVQAEAVITTLL